MKKYHDSPALLHRFAPQMRPYQQRFHRPRAMSDRPALTHDQSAAAWNAILQDNL